MKFASIDIGSNSVRLLLSQVIEDHYEQPVFKKESLVRMPLRLGDDAFTHKAISGEKIQRLLQTMNAFRFMIRAYQAVDYLACATSAMREAQNANEIVKQIEEYTEIKIEIISGRREAEIIYANHIEKLLGRCGSYLYVDVGGGSTQITLFSKGQCIASRSFNIGTIRILEDLVTPINWKTLKSWVKKITADCTPIVGIGSGGNINKAFSFCGRKQGKPLSYKKLAELHSLLKAYSVEERIRLFGLRPDRADVIIPALEIYLGVLKWACIDKIYVPQIGLSDGLIHILYDKHKSRNAFIEIAANCF